MWSYFFALCLLAYGPSMILFYFIISKKATLSIILISAAFFWYLASIIFSIVWYITNIEQIYGLFILVTIIIQELFRYLYYWGYNKVEIQFMLTASNGVIFPMIDLTSSLSSGFGWGLISVLLLYGSVIGDSIGPGTLYSENCPTMSIFVLAALYSMLFIFQHCCWMIIAFDGYRRNCKYRILFVAITHLIAEYFTLLNTFVFNGCWLSVGLEFFMVGLLIFVANYCITQPDYRSKYKLI